MLVVQEGSVELTILLVKMDRPLKEEGEDQDLEEAEEERPEENKLSGEANFSSMTC